jgi:hypothetical protein
MTFHEEVAALKARIAAAHAERDGWRASGMQEKYLEAYSRVEALEVQLEGLRHEGLRRTARSEHPKADLGDVPGDEDGVRAAPSVHYDGPRQVYDGERYDQLQERIGLAGPRQSPPGGEAAAPVPSAEGPQAPDPLQRELMAQFGVSFRDNAYHLGPYRYEVLDDAVNYARLLRMQGREAN